MNPTKSHLPATVLFRKKEDSTAMDNKGKLKKSLRLVWGLVSLILLLGCSNKTFESEKEFLAFIQKEENGYIYSKTIAGVDYVLQYRPTDLLVKQELGDNINTEKVKASRKKYHEYMYFNLSMSQNNKELLSTTPKDRNEFGAMVNQLSFGMEQKVHLYTPSKYTVDMIDFIYPRMYGLSRATTIMFVYPRDEKALKESYLNFVIEDLGLFTGEVKFKIKTDKLINEPILKF
jgi:hypothetical protein